MYHVYTGDEVDVTGPAVLVRQNVADVISFSASYYVDAISGASVDVRTYASPFKDERTQLNLGTDFVYQDAMMGISYTTSTESDYDAQTLDVNLSHETFGGMTTFSMGYSHGLDVVEKVYDNLENIVGEKNNEVVRNNYRLGLAQVFTPTFLMSFNYEGITEHGFLQSPYRAIFFRQGGNAPPVFLQNYSYPRTRTSHAIGLTAKKMLPQPSLAVELGYRFYLDTWEIAGQTVYTNLAWRVREKSIIDAYVRYYRQNKAAFYQDVYEDFFNFMGRDKEISTFNDVAVGFKYSLEMKPFQFIDRASINFAYEFALYNYKDFSDFSPDGNGSAFNFRAQTLQVYYSMWY